MTRWQFYFGLLMSVVAILAFTDIGSDWMDAGWPALEKWLAGPILSWRSSALTPWVLALTQLGSFPALTLIVALAMGLPHQRLGGRDKAVLLTLSVLQGLLNGFLKGWFGRPRPGIDYSPLVEEPYFSFPSGHSMSSLCVYGFLAYLVVRKRPRSAWIVIPVTAFVVLAIGVSRIYLSAHYPGDVVGGFAAGWPCLFAAMVAHAGLKPDDGFRPSEGLELTSVGSGQSPEHDQ